MKQIKSSKTVWLNLLIAIIAILGITTPVIQVWFPDEDLRLKVYELILFVSGALNIVIRVFFTSEKLNHG